MQTIENPQRYLEEDEIDLRELGRTIWSHKFGIAIFSFWSLLRLFCLRLANQMNMSQKRF